MGIEKVYKGTMGLEKIERYIIRCDIVGCNNKISYDCHTREEAIEKADELGWVYEPFAWKCNKHGNN